MISNPCKLDYKMNYLVVRTVEDCTRIVMEEIAILVIESTRVNLTAYLLSELLERNIRVVFCDHKHQPQAELSPLHPAFDSSKKLLQQVHWLKSRKDVAWKKIIEEKILRQAALLKHIGRTDGYDELKGYAEMVSPGDPTNREAVAAKSYFPMAFGEGFVRTDEGVANAVLNYGYAVILSAISREISIAGYFGNVGIFHRGGLNPFNLGCDLFEPLRPLVDACVIHLKADEVSPAVKKVLCELLFKEVTINQKKQLLLNAIRIYCQSFFRFINDPEVNNIDFIDYEF